MKTKLFLLVLCLFAWGSSVSQNKLNITKVNATYPVVVINPLMVDSANLKGEKFEAKQLLETTFLAKKADFKEEISSDSSNTIFFQKAKDGNELRLFSFNVNVNKHAKLKVSVTSTGLL
jgi:hypothetical protein